MRADPEANGLRYWALCAALAKVGEGLLGETIELASLGIALDLAIEARAVERIEPIAEFGELVGRKLGDGVFEV
jgi:hypothetical protein